VTQKRTSTFTSGISMVKFCESWRNFSKVTSTFRRQLFRLQNINPTFFLITIRFLNNSDSFGVSDVTNLLATGQSTTIHARKCSYNWIRDSKPNPYGTNPSSGSSEDNKTTVFVSSLDRTSGGVIFSRENFGIRSCWKFYHICSLGRRIYPAVLRFFFSYDSRDIH
jgi:hypothetical protein